MLSGKFKQLWEQPNQEGLMKEFLKSIRPTGEASFSLISGNAEDNYNRYQFSNFTSIIVKPGDENIFRELISSLSGRLDIEAIKIWWLQQAKPFNSPSTLSLFVDVHSHFSHLVKTSKNFAREQSDKGLPAFDNEVLLKACDPTYILVSDSTTICNRINNLLNAQNLLNIYAYKKLTSYKSNFYRFVETFIFFDHNTAAALQNLKKVCISTAKVREYLQTHLIALQRKQRKKQIFEKTLRDLLLIKKVTQMDALIKESEDDMYFYTVGQALSELQLEFNSDRDNFYIFKAFKKKIETQQNKIYDIICKKVTYSVVQFYKSYLNYFCNILEGKEELPPENTLSLPLLGSVRVFCVSQFLNHFRREVGSTVRKMHAHYLSVISKSDAFTGPKLRLLEAYFYCMNKIFSSHKIVSLEICKVEEAELFGRLLASQAHRFLKKLIDNFSLEEVGLNSIQKAVNGITNYATNIAIDRSNSLLTLPNYLFRLALNAKQQNFLNSLPMFFAEESWTPAVLSIRDKNLLDYLQCQESSEKPFFRCVLVFIDHINCLKAYRDSWPDIEHDVEQRTSETIEVLRERLIYLLVDGYATDYNKIKKINSRILATAIVQLECINNFLPRFLTHTLSTTTAALEQTIEMFLNKIICVLQLCIERSANTFFKLEGSYLNSPSIYICDVTKNLSQLFSSVSPLLKPQHLLLITSQAHKLIEKFFLSRLHAMLKDEVDKSEKSTFLNAQLEFLVDNTSALFKSTTTATTLEISPNKLTINSKKYY